MAAFASTFSSTPERPIRIFMADDDASVSVGHGPGAPANQGTAPDRGTPLPDSNLTGIDATQEDQSSPPAAGGTRPDAPNVPLGPSQSGQERGA